MIMNKPELIYTTYIRTTPEKLWNAITNPEFARQYWGGNEICSRLENGLREMGACHGRRGAGHPGHRQEWWKACRRNGWC